MEKGSKVYPKFNQHLNFSGLSWTEPLTQITLPNVMIFQSTFAVNPLQARLLDRLHPACPCLLTCIFGVPTTAVQKLRTRSSWKTLNHVLLPLAFPVLFLLVTLACTLIFDFLYTQVHGSAGEIWAGWLLWLLLSTPITHLAATCLHGHPWFSLMALLCYITRIRRPITSTSCTCQFSSTLKQQNYVSDQWGQSKK